LCLFSEKSWLSQHGFFSKWLGMYDKTKGKNRGHLTRKKKKGRSKDSLHRSSSTHHPLSAKLDFELLSSQYQHRGEHRKVFY